MSKVHKAISDKQGGMPNLCNNRYNGIGHVRWKRVTCKRCLKLKGRR